MGLCAGELVCVLCMTGQSFGRDILQLNHQLLAVLFTALGAAMATRRFKAHH